MKRRSILWIALAVLILILGTGAVSTKATDLARFTVDNDSDSFAYIQLSGGPKSYYLRHSPNTDYVWTVQKGEYDYTLYACGGAVKSGTVDFTKNQKWVIPSCGDKAFTTNSGDGSKDIGREIRMVRVKLTNKTSQQNLIVVVYDYEGSGAVWVFTLTKNVTKHITLPKGKYSYIAYGCGGSWTGTFWADHPHTHNDILFTCP